MKEKESEYDKQARDFLETTNTTIEVTFLKNGKYFESDKDDDKRDIYNIIMQRGERKIEFKFGQSINDSGFKLIRTADKKEIKYTWFKDLSYYQDHDEIKLKKELKFRLCSIGGFTVEIGKPPSAYSVLATLHNYDPGTFEDFCSEFGYDTDSKSAEKTYNAVSEQYRNLLTLYNDKEMELLREIN